MKIGILQTDIKQNHSAQWANLFDSLKRNIDGHQIVCLPELFHTNYKDLPKNAMTLSSDKLRAFRQFTIYYPGTIFIGSIAIRKRTKIFNTVVLFYNGTAIELYNKIHLFKPMGEDRLITKGNSLSFLNLNFAGFLWKISFAVCYDLRFPEIFRIMAMNNTNLVIVPAQWPEKRIVHWKTFLKARAIENQFYIVGTNRIGDDGSEIFGGYSSVYNPSGDLFASAYDKKQFLTITLPEHFESTFSLPFKTLSDRCPDLYDCSWKGKVKEQSISLLSTKF